MTDKHDAAFACCNEETFHQYGLTKREYFAAMAMQGLMANSEYCAKVSHGNPGYYAKKSVEVADALIEALNKE